MKGPQRSSGATLIEAVIASTLLLILVGVGFSFMLVQTNLAKQQSAEALGNVRAQQAFDRVADAVRDCVLDDSATDFCAAADPTETIGKLRLFPIETADPYANLKLQIAENQSAVIDVIDEAGAPLAKTHDASVSGTGRLRFGIDTSFPLDGVPDTQIRILAHDVSQFRVIDQGGQFIRVELTLSVRTQGVSETITQDSSSVGQVSVQYYDVNTME